MKFWDFSYISKFPKIISFKSFGSLWSNSEIPCLLLIITLCFTWGERKIWSNIKCSQDIMIAIVVLDFFLYFVLISFMLKAFIIRFFSPKTSSICFMFHLMNTQFFMSIALFHSLADMIYITAKNKILLSVMQFSWNSTLVILIPMLILIRMLIKNGAFYSLDLITQQTLYVSDTLLIIYRHRFI